MYCGARECGGGRGDLVVVQSTSRAHNEASESHSLSACLKEVCYVRLTRSQENP